MICHGGFAAESCYVVFHEIRGYFVDVWGENAWDAVQLMVFSCTLCLSFFPLS